MTSPTQGVPGLSSEGSGTLVEALTRLLRLDPLIAGPAYLPTPERIELDWHYHGGQGEPRTMQYRLSELATHYGMPYVSHIPEVARLIEADTRPEPGCCPACHGAGHNSGEPCLDCYGTGHAHDGPCTPAPQEPAEPILAMKAGAWYHISGRGVCASFEADQYTGHDPDDLRDQIVEINGVRYHVLGVESHRVPRSLKQPYHQNFGLLVQPVKTRLARRIAEYARAITTNIQVSNEEHADHLQALLAECGITQDDYRDSNRDHHT